jgi:hypothetical protein
MASFVATTTTMGDAGRENHFTRIKKGFFIN